MLSLKKTVSHSAVPDAPFSPKGQSLFSSKFTVQEKNPQQRLITIHDLQDVSPLTSLPANDAGFDPSPQGASSFTDSRRPSYASQFTTSSIGSAGTTNNTPVGGSTEANSIYSSNSACNISSNANNTPASTDSGTRAKVNPISFPQPDDVFDNKEFQRFTQARSQSQTSESSNSNNNYNNNSSNSNSNNNNSNNNNNLSAKNVRTDSVDSSSVSTKKSKKSFLGKFISRRESSADFNERNKRLKPKNSEANLRTVSNASSFKIDLHNPLSHRPSAGFFTSHRDNNDSESIKSRTRSNSITKNSGGIDKNSISVVLNESGRKTPNNFSDIYTLDTDLEHMAGIVDGPKASHSASNSISNLSPFIGDPLDSTSTTTGTSGKFLISDSSAVWEAPESWSIMPDIAAALQSSIDLTFGSESSTVSSSSASTSKDYSKNPSTTTTVNGNRKPKPTVKHCVRIFRENGTFGTISCDISTTVTELIQLLGRKFFLPSVAGYQLTVQVGGLKKILLPKEKPLMFQQELLEFMGYTEDDRIGDVGREDLSYLCRFEFGTLEMRSFTEQEKMKLSRDYKHADMQNMDLQTIPVLFYSHCAEIEHLDVSENPSITIPSDFVQACTNLKSIRYVRNRAIQFPLNVLYACHLSYLDLSQNLISHLENIDFSKLSSLITLDLHGNKLSSIHESISDLKSLQCLNLSSNDLSEIHPSICSISTLRQLDFSFNRLHTIPEEIGKLINLNDFAVNNNYIAKKLPDTFPNLVNLRDLDLRYNKLQSIDILSQLPNLEVLYCSKNSVSSFSAEFPKLKLLYFDRNPITKIELIPTLSTLTVLNLSKAKIVALQETFLEKIPFVEKLVLDKNHLSSLPPHIGSLKCLIYLSVVANNLDSVPPEIGLLHELRHLDLHNNNIQSLPEDIWNLSCLDHLNVSSNLLESFPKRPAQSSTSSSESERSKIFGDLVHNYELGSARRPSTLSISSSLGPNDRRMSAFPVNNRYSPAAFSPVGLRQRRTLANCLITLSLSDNRLTDECFEEISWLTELQVLNLSYNELVDIPYGALRQLHHLTELYLSGNNLTSLPADDLERIQSLRILHVNSNKLHSLPAELGKIRNLTCLDVGSNNLKYNINNWPYDWNWNYNLNLKYLNFSGNRRLEVKAQHNQSSHFGRDLPDKDLSDFTVLNSVRVLGLMDVTLITQTVPDQTENCRVRAYGSEINSMPYGLADSIGHNENLSVIDMVIERFRGKDNEVVIGLFDGRSDDALGGNKVSKLIQENFGSIFSQELKKLRENETVQDALRRAFLNTNKEIGNTSLLSSQELAHSSLAHRSSTAMSLDYHDGMTGSCATIVYIVENKMYVANSGDSMAIISRGSGEFSVLTTRHDPTAQDELGRIRQGGGVVSSTGQLDDILDVSRALGYYNLIPHIHATPSITEYDLADNDEILIIGSKHLWEYVSYQIALDVVRMSEGDFMRAAAKLRDFAIAYGASDKIMVMIIGVGISRRKSKSRIIGTSFGPMTSIGEEELFPAFKRKRDRSLLPEDSELARLGGEVDPPVNELAMVFTDIKNSTLLWETSPTAMRSAIKIHNSIMRRQLRIIGGYEVKTEGDAFMVSFPTPTSALLWSLSVQSLLLVADWPAEILECLEGGEILDENAEVIFRGLSVRMGIHWGSPVCEKDPITRRMDYFGPMVNRAARVSAVADGGQIALSFDFVAELKKLESAYNRYNSEESVTLAESFAGDEALGLAIEHDLKMLNNQGWVLKELGEEKLKGLENPEFISLAYQKSLLGRYKIHQERLELKRSASTKRYSAQQPSKIPQAYLDLVLQLRHITLRLERVCAKLSTFAMGQVEEEHNQRTSLFLGPGFHFTNEHDYAVMLNNLVTRIENCLSTVYLRATAQSIVMATNASAGDSTDGPITNNEAQLVANLLKLGPGSHGLSDILKALLNV
mgnify:CR=1 FL=1